MNKIYTISALIAGMLSLASCNDNEPSVVNPSAEAKDAINFSIGLESPSSRTQYAENDWLQIEWLIGDKISIFSGQTVAPKTITDKTKAGYYEDNNWQPLKSAGYEVSQINPEDQVAYDVELAGGGTASVTNNNKARIKASSTDPKKILYWGKNNVTHTFYAAYGAGITMDDPSSGLIKCVYDPEQFLTEVNGTWINMAQAYMVSYKETSPVENVALHFKPIMTTVEVDVKAPTNNNVKIKALEIKIPASQDVIYLDNGAQSTTTATTAYFDYRITGQNEQGQTTGEVVPASKQTAERIFFNLPSNATVGTDGFIKIAAILPPIEISSTYPITITVYATDGCNSTVYAEQVATSKKAVIKTNNAWKPKYPTMEYVDLGTGVKWATCNLGANKPEEYGDYFCWGSTVPYATSTIPQWDPYFRKLGKTGTTTYTKSICGTKEDPLNGKSDIAKSEWDAAYVRLNGAGRMPTSEEWSQLANQNNFSWDKVTVNDVLGYKVTRLNGNCKGNFIFLPFGGGLDDIWHEGIFTPSTGAVGYYDIGVRCYYWTSTIDSDKSNAHDFVAPQTSSATAAPNVGQYARYHGRTIRPVQDKTTTRY
ncbi:MAG: hypothetical protein HUJ83_10255 [Veillonella sp.]|nr:hypothetical protein [Veillonella sp.]